MPDLWERQPGEPALWHGRFLAYRDLGPGRSLLAACASGRAVPVRWYDVAEQWQWRERAAVWDAAERGRVAAEGAAERERARHERIQVLRATRGRALADLQSLTRADPDYFKTLRVLSGITREMRQEMSDG